MNLRDILNEFKNTERLVVVMIQRSKQSFKKQTTTMISLMILAAAFEVKSFSLVDLFLLFH
jgi:hypothetical protein